MLFVLPFIVMAISFFSTYVPAITLKSVPVTGVINIAFVNELNNTWISVIGFIMVLGLAYMIFFVNEKYKFLSQTTTLPSLIYILLTSGIMVNLGFNYFLISVFILALAIGRLQAAINNTQTNSAIYDFGCRSHLSEICVADIMGCVCVVFFRPFHVERYYGVAVRAGDSDAVCGVLLFLGRPFAGVTCDF